MREISDQNKIDKLMRVFGEKISQDTNVYFVGGTTAVLLGFRSSTIDADLKFEPDTDEVYKAIRDLKEKLHINIELASPDHFLPPLPGWESRSVFIKRVGKVSFYHYDLYSQVLAKVERGWEMDLKDAEHFVGHSVDMDKLMDLFNQIQPQLIRYPGIEPQKLKEKLDQFRSSIHEKP
ncbi:MAG: hypothetical protein HYS08_10230 [Chlamydiae bacterium]|nr:hypothetical protein [Chlamydiota bacterium]MBI3266271.1 hypothetical protein [Chlamydiota bacterium]